MLTFEQGKNFFALLKQVIDQHYLELNTLDSIVGDGDHGFTMQRGVTEIEKRLSVSDCHDFAELFDTAAIAFAEGSGGAIGPILSAFFAEGGVLFKGKTFLSTEDLVIFIEKGAESIMQVGGAVGGDKTILDAMIPAYEFLALNKNREPKDILEETWQITKKAAEATGEMIARQGRARFLKENSRNFQDAGATSFSWIIYALWKAANDATADVTAETQAGKFRPHGKFINNPEDIVHQDNQGLALAYPELVKLTDDGVLIRAQQKEPGKVGIAIGHGGGHTPSMGGFIGHGLLDADVYGPIFTCASGVKISRAIQYADRNAGVILLVSNHTGDVLNAKLAVRRAEQAGIPLEMVLTSDDIATAPRSQAIERRGLGGLLFALKMGGAAAERGLPLKSVATIMRKANERTASLSVALSAPTHPTTGKPLFEIAEDHLEIGTGVHGEAGVYSGILKPAKEIVTMVVDQLIKDLACFKAKQYLVFLNGSGGTSLMELHILFQDIYHFLVQNDIQPVGSVVGSFFTTQEMKGFSISLCALTAEMEAYWNDPAGGACFHWPYK